MSLEKLRASSFNIFHSLYRIGEGHRGYGLVASLSLLSFSHLLFSTHTPNRRKDLYLSPSIHATNSLSTGWGSQQRKEEWADTGSIRQGRKNPLGSLKRPALPNKDAKTKTKYYLTNSLEVTITTERSRLAPAEPLQ